MSGNMKKVAKKQPAPSQSQTKTNAAKSAVVDLCSPYNLSVMPVFEHFRLQQQAAGIANWSLWGPYLSSRQWGTVREGEDPWNGMSFEAASCQNFKNGEDGLFGISDSEGRLCFGYSLWNGADCMLKSRLFGLTNPEGNHGEDVKEVYAYKENLPSHAYMRARYLYPQKAFPYQELREEAANRGKDGAENKLEDTGVFDDGFFDLEFEYGKHEEEDMLISLTVVNKSDKEAELRVIPQLWFRDIHTDGDQVGTETSHMNLAEENGVAVVTAQDSVLGNYKWLSEQNVEYIFSEYCDKHAIQSYVIDGCRDAVNCENCGSRAGAVHLLKLPAGGKAVVRSRLYGSTITIDPTTCFSNKEFSDAMDEKQKEVERYFNLQLPEEFSSKMKKAAIDIYSQVLWNQQVYSLPAGTIGGLSACNGLISASDGWEFPSFFAFDTALQSMACAPVGAQLARDHLDFILQNQDPATGQIAANEMSPWGNFPPILAQAVLAVARNSKDPSFLARSFDVLIKNLTGWLKQQDSNGKTVLEGGFISVADTNIIDKSDAFIEDNSALSWTLVFCVGLLEMAIELSKTNPAYEEKAIELFKLYSESGKVLEASGMWNEEDNWFYHLARVDGGDTFPLRVKSLSSLTPLLAMAILPLENQTRKVLDKCVAAAGKASAAAISQKRSIFIRPALLDNPKRLSAIAKSFMDPEQFLSPAGLRSVSKSTADEPSFCRYEPGHTSGYRNGGNSNWCGPVWMAQNFMMAQALVRWNELQPQSGLRDVAAEIARRAVQAYLPENQTSAKFGGDLPQFPEFFDAESGEACGAKHHGAWAALAIPLMRLL